MLRLLKEKMAVALMGAILAIHLARPTWHHVGPGYVGWVSGLAHCSHQQNVIRFGAPKATIYSAKPTAWNAIENVACTSIWVYECIVA